MKKRLAQLATTLALLSLSSQAHAQTIVPAAYSGPRFPGGPDSTPAQFQGRPVRVSYVVPVNFKMQ